MTRPLPAITTAGRLRSNGRGSRLSHVLCPVVALVCGLLPSPVAAQAAERFGAGASFEIYRFSDEAAIGIRQLSLLTVPLAVRLPATPSLTLSLSGAWARASLERADGSTATIAGPTDTELRASYVFGADRFTLSAVALLPTGHEQLEGDEAEVAGAIGADVLPFRVSNWGTGGGLGASAAVAVPLGEFAAGVSAGYVVAREFEPLADNSSFVYRPGNQLHLTAAIDRTAGTGKFALRVSYLTFNADRTGDQNLYQSGDRIQATASYGFAAGPRANGLVYGGFLHRGEGEFSVSSQINPGQDMVFGGLGGRVPFGRGVLQPGLDLRVVTGSDDSGKGYTAGAGVTGEFPLSGATFAPTLRLRYGNAEPRTGSQSTYLGADLGLGFRFGGRL